MRHALIDTDPGIDDALALLLAWGAPEWTVDVVTVVAGNVAVEAGTLNVLRLVDLGARHPRRSSSRAPRSRWRGRYGPRRTTAVTASATCPTGLRSSRVSRPPMRRRSSWRPRAAMRTT